MTSRVIRDRLLKEAEGNVALRDRRSRADKDCMRSRRPRRTAARHPDRDRCAAKASSSRVSRPKVVFSQRRGHRPDARADRGSRHRRRRGAFGRRRAEDVRAPGRDAGDAPVRRRPHAPRLPRADARPDRLSRRAPDRHARHGHHEPPVPRLRAVQGRDRRPPQRRADLQRAPARPWPTRCGTSRIAAR